MKVLNEMVSAYTVLFLRFGYFTDIVSAGNVHVGPIQNNYQSVSQGKICSLITSQNQKNISIY